MSRHPTPTWPLSKDWGVGTDKYSFILYRKGKKYWSAAGYYPSAELLLKSLHRKLARTEAADPDLVKHVEAISRRVQASAAALYTYIDAVAAQDWKKGVGAGDE